MAAVPAARAAGRPAPGHPLLPLFTFGELGDPSVLETRQNRSSAQIDGPPFTTKGGGFIPADTPGLADPNRHLPEPEQLTWLGFYEVFTGGAQPDPRIDPSVEPVYDSSRKMARFFRGRIAPSGIDVAERRGAERFPGHHGPGEQARGRASTTTIA
ncbi:MAG: hypothetical protein M3500_14205 [Actinomycetota bacterium]|nr:hypothetical protein [Actinomycetota bacterium]